MNVNNSEDLKEKIVCFIVQEISWAKKEELKLTTNIVEDFGIWGDDCDEFLENFCKEFNVKCTNINFEKCGEEGFNPITMMVEIINIYLLKRESKKMGYTVKELMNIVTRDQQSSKGDSRHSKG